MTNIKSFQKFLNRQPLYLVMFGHIEALRLNHLQFGLDQAIKNFALKYNLSEDDFPLETARKAYSRMQKDLYDTKKSDGNSA